MASWLDNAIMPERRERTVDAAIDALSKVDFDTIAVSGVSGLLLGPILAYKLGKNLAVVRKTDDSTHSYCTIEGQWGSKYVIIDDFIASGATVRYIRDKLDNRFGLDGEFTQCVGFYGYDRKESFEHTYQADKCDGLGIPYLCPAPLNA